MKKLLAAILIATAAFAAGHAATMATIDIQTDGDGDSAIVQSLGLEYFKGINGYTVDCHKVRTGKTFRTVVQSRKNEQPTRAERTLS